ncbi:hypothetical protein [Arthrobacter sp. zg-Y1143]|uniref:hypothetical protein n=1 Tax=Arthrobacter sp. zg-Y1143 TaxID=3049065 RepID=UPI0024C3FA75|nr:hypothetical protein [Arthrobacter sp. zg-Y1143]MDK1328238.1 hypothetical protein [Arthrobacter sp. zg-Y1143]
MEYQYPYSNPDTPDTPHAPAAVDSRPVQDNPLGIVGTIVMVLVHLLYLATALPAFFVYLVATDLTVESHLTPLSFWASFGWLITLIGGWAVFLWFHRGGAGRSGALVFLLIFAVWASTSLLVALTL